MNTKAICLIMGFLFLTPNLCYAAKKHTAKKSATISAAPHKNRTITRIDLKPSKKRKPASAQIPRKLPEKRVLEVSFGGSMSESDVEPIVVAKTTSRHPSSAALTTKNTTMIAKADAPPMEPPKKLAPLDKLYKQFQKKTANEIENDY